MSDAAYCKVFRTTLIKRNLTWFNQLPIGYIIGMESYIFTIKQKENENLLEYIQCFIEAVSKVSHVSHELLASILQQNLRLGRLK
ncbi:hypothetical protein Pfo_005359 [Paulownia fortunei]|nr:hypothetical protein Pfo_005359 [Paulownia fortunei]